MSWSLGEIGALATRAARGAGHPWGVAEETGWAVRWLAMRGLPGPEALAALLAGARGECPVILGLAIADTGRTDLAGAAGPVAEPLLAVPFLGRCAPAGGALGLRTALGDCLVWPGGTDLRGRPPSGTPVSLGGPAVRPPARPGLTRIAHVASPAMAVLQAAAARLHAPATEASRLKGAGSGLIDGD